jgi:hypothetical protein
LLDQITGPLVSVIADGAYDQDGVYADVADRHPDAAVIVPPRSTAVLSVMAATAPTQRDRHILCIAERRRMAWQKASERENQSNLKKNALCYYWRFFVNSGAGGHSFSNSQATTGAPRSRRRSGDGKG